MTFVFLKKRHNISSKNSIIIIFMIFSVHTTSTCFGGLKRTDIYVFPVLREASEKISSLYAISWVIAARDRLADVLHDGVGDGSTCTNSLLVDFAKI